MPRNLKKTRIKGIPPKIQLQIKEAMTGSYPTTARIASDNRTGVFGFRFNDAKTAYFKSYSDIEFPSGLPTSNLALYRTDVTGTILKNVEMTTNLKGIGVIRKGVGDEWVERSSYPDQPLMPFRDNDNPATDGLSTNNSFYLNGSKVSDVGEGFNQPLWSKSKIEIDLTPSMSHSFWIQNTLSSSNNYPMAYWNKDRKIWEGIGRGREFANYISGAQADLNRFFEDQCIGFGHGMQQGGTGISDRAAGAKVSNWGFPFHVKYHGTSSNTIAMSNYITEPFLLEKIVLEWSGSFFMNNTSYSGSTAFALNTFFVLNQRKPFGYSDVNYQIFVARDGTSTNYYFTTGAQIPSIYNNGSSINTIRDLVTYMQFTRFTAAATQTHLDYSSRELNTLNNDPTSIASANWTGKFIMSGTVKNALPNDGLSSCQVGMNDSGVRTFMLINKNSTRSGIFSPGGRDFLGALEQGQVVETQTLFSGPPDGIVKTLDKYSKINPYLLMPTDQLIFGWQLPFSNRINSAFGIEQYSGKGTELSFSNVPSKIVFYGSCIREAREHHETLNQDLTSVSINEIIK